MDSIDKINILLTTKGLSGADLMRTIGLSHGVYSQWNTKITKPSNKNLAKVANALGVSIDEILSDSISSDAKKEAPPSGGASGKDDLVRLSEDAQDRLYKIFSAALEANNITGGFAVSRTGVDSTILTRMQNKRLSMANRSELMQLARFLEVQAEAEPLIQGLPALEETLADIYRQLHDQIYQIDPDDIGTVSEVLQVWIKSRKKQ